MQINKWQRWLLLAVVAVVQLGLIWSYKGDYEEVAQNGTRYIWPVQIWTDRDTDYLQVQVPQWQARWLNPNPPAPGEAVYVSVAPDAKGHLMVKGADLVVPPQGDYLRTQAWSAPTDGVIGLQLPVNRYYIGKQKLQQLPLEEYAAEDEVDISDQLTPEEKAAGAPTTKVVPRHELLAVVRVLEGDAVITDVLVDGRSIGALYPTGEAGDAPVKVPAQAPAQTGTQAEKGAPAQKGGA